MVKAMDTFPRKKCIYTSNFMYKFGKGVHGPSRAFVDPKSRVTVFSKVCHYLQFGFLSTQYC